MCEVCAGKGLVQVGYESEPEGYRDIAICLCRTGMQIRERGREAAIASVAGRFKVPADTVGMIEEILDPEDLPVRFRKPAAAVDDDILSVGSSKHGRKAKL